MDFTTENTESEKKVREKQEGGIKPPYMEKGSLYSSMTSFSLVAERSSIFLVSA
jgi:hypothetical protein